MKELPVDILEFFFLTPLPGSEDHQKLVHAGVELDSDLNKYDLNHVTAPHNKMSRDGLGTGLSRRLADLLHERTHGDGAAPAGRETVPREQRDPVGNLVHGSD